jgi:site-specific recombinase XerD
MSNDTSQYDAHITAQTLLPPAIHAWEIYLQDQDRSPYTIKAFSGDIHLLASYLLDRPVGAISTNDLNHFLKWLQHGRGVPCSPKSLARRITSIKSFYRWLHSKGVVPVNPAEKVLQQSVISPLPVILTPVEEQLLIKVTQDYRDGKITTRKSKNADARPYTLLALLLATGIKKGECLAINPNHIDLDAPGGPLLFVRYSNPNHRYKERKISLPGDWVECYQEYQNQYELKDQLFPWSPRRLEYLLEEIGEKAGLKKHLSFDMCRWTSAVNDKLAGMEEDKLRQKLGISKIQWREVKMKINRLISPTQPDDINASVQPAV